MDMLKKYFNCNKHNFARHKCFHNIAKNISLKNLKTCPITVRSYQYNNKFIINQIKQKDYE